MSKHRWFILGILSFFGFIFAHGSWINRLLAVILCGLLGADSGLCMATVAKYSGKTVAATPAMVEEILLAQRSREFDDPPVAPPPGNNQPVPAFPQDAGPDYIRPDFGDGNPTEMPNEINQDLQELLGIWAFSFYTDPSDDYPFLMLPIEITNKDGQPAFSLCDNLGCGQYSITDKYPDGHQFTNEIISLAYSDGMYEEWLMSVDRKAFWRKIEDNQSNPDNPLYIFVEKLVDFKSNNFAFKSLASDNMWVTKNDKIADITVSSGLCVRVFKQVGQWLSRPLSKTNIPKSAETVGDVFQKTQTAARNVGRTAEQLAKERKAAEYINSISWRFRRFLDEQGRIIKEWWTQTLTQKEDKLDFASNPINLSSYETNKNLHANVPCIPSAQLLTSLGRVAGIVAGAFILGTSAAIADWCFQNPQGCELLMRNPEAAFNAIIAQLQGEQNIATEPVQTAGQPSGDVLYVGTINFTQLCDRKKPEGYYYNEYPKTDNLTQGLCTVTKPMGRELAPRIEINFDIADGAQYCRERFSQHQDPGIRQVASSAFVQVSMSHWNRNREKRWDCFVSCPPNDTRCSPFNPQNGPFSR